MDEDYIPPPDENTHTYVVGECLPPQQLTGENITELEIHGDARIMSDWISHYEYCELITVRATQISENNICAIPIEGLTDPIDIAKAEFAAKKCPLLIRRPYPHHKKINGITYKLVEIWNPNEMNMRPFK